MEIKVNIVQFANAEVLDSEGTKIKLGVLWQKNTVVFIFLRHFACVSCRAHAAQVWKEKHKFDAFGAKIIFIGNGAPQFIDTFKEDLKIQGATIYTDPSLKSFQAVGFHRGFIRCLGPKGLMNGRALLNAGHKQGRYNSEMGDLWQLGGVIVVKPDGHVPFQYLSEATGDFPLEEDLEKIPWLSS